MANTYTPTVNINLGEPSRVDPRFLRKVARSRRMMAEQDATAIQARLLTSKWTPEQRQVYMALQDGIEDADTIVLQTGLSRGDVLSSLKKFENQGFVKLETSSDVTALPI
jgi:DNA-binding MarR family transcriptional regulator